MARLFHYKVVNDAFGDPCVYVKLLREKRALLFDLGDIRKIPFSELLKVSHIFVTHTHIDHFIGFDQVLRAILRREEPLKIYGPLGIIKNVQGKLMGYTWNLLSDYPLSIEVYEITKDKIKEARFSAKEAFKIEKIRTTKIKENTIVEDVQFKVKAIELSHGIPVIAYSIEEDFHINVDKVELERAGFPIGPWLGELKRVIKNFYRLNSEGKLELKDKVNEDLVIDTPKGKRKVDSLLQLLRFTKGEKISYVMDVAPTEDNVNKVIDFVKDSDILFCEAYFSSRDSDRAKERNHLTTALTGKIAREAKVEELVILHISPKYLENPHEIYREVELSKQKDSD